MELWNTIILWWMCRVRDSSIRGYYPGFKTPIGTFNPRSIMILGVKISLSGNFL